MRSWLRTPPLPPPHTPITYVSVLYTCSDLNCLSSSAPPAAAEYQSLLRPLRGREPEGIWNLLSIVRELLRRRDSNAVPLLEILTDEMLQCEQVCVCNCIWYSLNNCYYSVCSAYHTVVMTKCV